MIIIDDFLEKPLFDKIQEEFMGNEIPWYYNPTKSKGEGQEDLRNQQMFHMIYGFDHMIQRKKSHALGMVMPLLFKLKPLAILRWKANLQQATQDIYQSPFHCDSDNIPDNVFAYTGVYYVNSNNGYTIFEDTGDKVYSEENRLVLFDSRRKHAGSTCTDEKVRVVINLNFIPSNETLLEEKITKD